MSDTLVISRVGAKGDGVAMTAAGPIHVPYALPGETVPPGAPSIHRQAPICPLFGRCGGCAAQHMAPDFYAAWKHGLVADMLRRAGIEVPVLDMIDAHGEGRRRVTFHARTDGAVLRVGFMAAGTHDIVDVPQCPVLAPSLAQAPRVAYDLAAMLASSAKPLDIQVTASDAGLDVDIRGHGPVEGKRRLTLSEAATRLDLARLSIHGDIIIERRSPGIAMGKAMVAVPTGSFLQATARGEQILAELIIAGVGSAKKVADLFAGAGPFALRLAEKRQVHAIDSTGPALAALDRAARQAPGLRGITTETRDLFRRPLMKHELAAYDAVVLDPPRAGAEAQVREIAKSALERVVMVSCDAKTFARDCAILIEAGFVMGAVQPVDQFRYARHIELVATLQRPSAGRTKGRR